jgi:hypothetical protein
MHFLLRLFTGLDTVSHRFSDMSLVNHGVGAEGLLAAQSALSGK